MDNQEIVSTVEGIIEQYSEFLDGETTTIRDIIRIGLPLYSKAWDLGYELKYQTGGYIRPDVFVEGFVYAVSLADGSLIY